MPQNKRVTFGPFALTTTYTTNILNPPTATGGVNGGSSSNYILLYWARVINKTATAVTFRLFKGATTGNAAGTELAYDQTVAPFSFIDIPWPSGQRLDAADFLVGGASVTLSLVIVLGGVATGLFASGRRLR